MKKIFTVVVKCQLSSICTLGVFCSFYITEQPVEKWGGIGYNRLDVDYANFISKIRMMYASSKIVDRINETSMMLISCDNQSQMIGRQWMTMMICRTLISSHSCYDARCSSCPFRSDISAIVQQYLIAILGFRHVVSHSITRCPGFLDLGRLHYLMPTLREHEAWAVGCAGLDFGPP